MGSWNGTCCISHLPILEGDRIICVPIVKSSGRYSNDLSGNCYADCVNYPFFFPIVGEYNDYGGMQNIENDTASSLMVIAFNEMIKGGSMFSNDVQDFGDAETIIGEIERGHIMTKDKYGQTMPQLDLFYIHEGVFKAIVDRLGTEVETFYSSKVKGCYDATYAEYFEDSTNALEEKLESIRNMDHGEDAELSKVFMSLALSNDDYVLTKIISDCGNEYCRKLIMEIADGTITNLSGLAYATRSLWFIGLGLDSLRMGWVEQYGTGSQACQMWWNVMLAEETIRIAKEKKKRWE